MSGDLSFTTRPGLSRLGAGILGMSYPLGLISLSLTVGFRGTSQGEDLATAVLAAILFIIAAPTSWVFALDFIVASRLTVISVGALTSLPLWYLLGSRLGLTSPSWFRWFTRYLSVCGLWTMLMFGLIVVLARVT